MKNVLTILSCCVAFTVTVQAQSLLYAMSNKLLDLHKPPSYLMFVNKAAPLEQRVVPLGIEEGSNGFVIEPQIYLNVPVFQKRIKDVCNINQETIIPLAGYTRFFLKYRFHTRVIKDYSSPIIPPTNSFGFQLERPISLKQDGQTQCVWCAKREPARLTAEGKISMVYFRAGFMHFSNGQQDSSLIDSGIRNNYSSGDFSTNYATIHLGHSWLTKENWFFDVHAGFRWDFEANKKLLRYLPAQEGRYGKKRITGGFKVHSGKVWRECPLDLEIALQAQFDYILESKDLTDFPYENKYPLFMSWYLDLIPSKLRSIGLMFGWIYGRDPLNIRYDDPICMFQIGMSFDVKRYTSDRYDVESAK